MNALPNIPDSGDEQTYPRPSRVEQAEQVHNALVRTEAREPALKQNACWECVRADAYAAYVEALEADDA